MSQIVQGLALALGTKWKLHCKYNPQSSGQVEKNESDSKKKNFGKTGNRDWWGLGDSPSLRSLLNAEYPLKRHQIKTLKPRWKGPYVVLTTPTALKVDGVGPWVHCNHVRCATPKEQEKAQRK